MVMGVIMARRTVKSIYLSLAIALDDRRGEDSFLATADSSE
jgi:hypothetical protein